MINQKVNKNYQLPVLSSNKEVMGVITRRQITNYLTSFKLTSDKPITKAILKEFKKVKRSDPLKYLSKAFNRHAKVLVYEEEGNKYYIADSDDLLNFYLQKK